MRRINSLAQKKCLETISFRCAVSLRSYKSFILRTVIFFLFASFLLIPGFYSLIACSFENLKRWGPQLRPIMARKFQRWWNVVRPECRTRRMEWKSGRQEKHSERIRSWVLSLDYHSERMEREWLHRKNSEAHHGLTHLVNTYYHILKYDRVLWRSR